MSSDPIISVSGLRGIVGESLTPEIAVRYIAAWLADWPAGSVLLSRDGRATGSMLADAIRAAAMACGRDVLDCGVAPTPTVGVLVRDRAAAGGVQVTASHNPPEYNGIKLFSADGRVIPGAPGQRVLDRYRSGRSAWVTHEHVGKATSYADPLKVHLGRVLDIVNIDRIRSQRLHVLVDANHGSGGPLASALLARLGCEIRLLGGEPTGHFMHPPEPTAENLQAVLESVQQAGSHVGFCLDPDADRLAIIDEGGRYIGEELTLAICVKHLLQSARGPVVTNCSTSRMAEDLAKAFDVPFYRSGVGEANVVDLMLEHGAVVGGEGNGGVIDPRVGLVRDSFVAMALVLDAMADRNLPVSALADELPRYAIYKTKAAFATDRLSAAVEILQRRFSDARPDRLDGLRLDWSDKWVLIRPSNTEPIVRVIAEARDDRDARRLCEEVADVLARS